MKQKQSEYYYISDSENSSYTCTFGCVCEENKNLLKKKDYTLTTNIEVSYCNKCDTLLLHIRPSLIRIFLLIIATVLFSEFLYPALKRALIDLIELFCYLDKIVFN